jgi:hypothetical protein
MKKILAIIFVFVYASNYLIGQTVYSDTSRYISPENSAIIMIDTIPHDIIINISVNKIIEMYGEDTAIAIIRRHMLVEVNRIRAENGANPLQNDDALNKSVQWHCEYMADKMITTHQGFDFSSPEKRAKNHNFKGYNVSENVGFTGFISPTILTMLQQIMDSPLHFKILIAKRDSAFGFGYKSLYFGQVFGRIIIGEEKPETINNEF